MTNTQKSTVDGSGIDTWTEIITRGVTNAISGLSGMMGQEVVLTSMNARQIAVKDAADLVGGPEVTTAAIYLSISGAASGHMLIIYHPQTAFELIDMLLEQPQGTTQELGEMEESVLGEIGNVFGSFFLNALADATDLDLRVSPPTVMLDMAGAILDAVLAEVMLEMDEALVLETVFGTRDRQINGSFLCLPSLGLQSALAERWGKK